jgi:CheY-like chemotaxis protein
VHVESRGPTLDLHESLRVLLFEAARELLFNIVKHSGVREARICIAACDDRGVRMTVADQGRGIDPSVAAAGDPEGFGLFSLRERLSLIEGHLQIDSEPGRGTRVVIEAPLGPGAPGEETAAHEAAATPALRLVEPPEPELPASAPRVILADDHEVLRKGLASLLTQHGVAVVGEACDGEQAVALAVQLSPDVVVMDVSMPRLNGVEATRRLRAARPAVRVIGLSMHDSAEMASAMMSAGATAYLNKAGPPDQLVAAIRTARAAVEEVRARHA